MKLSKSNKDILISFGLRFLRVSGATILALLIPALADLLGQLELSDAGKGIITLILIPALTAIGKALRVAKSLK